MKITNSEQREKLLKVLVYGPSGVGKTVFGATAPDVLFLDIEAGMLSVADKNVDRMKIEKFDDIKEVFMFLKGTQHKYKTVVIDSLTEMQKKSMDAILESVGRDKPAIGDWGTNIEQIRKAVRFFRDLSMNVILIALEQQVSEDESGISIRMPGLSGKTLPQEIMGFVDIVGYMMAEERGVPGSKDKRIERAMRVQPNQTICAKDRSGKLGTFVRNAEDPTAVPTFQQIFDTVFAGFKETPKPEAGKEAAAQDDNKKEPPAGTEKPADGKGKGKKKVKGVK